MYIYIYVYIYICSGSALAWIPPNIGQTIQDAVTGCHEHDQVKQ